MYTHSSIKEKHIYSLARWLDTSETIVMQCRSVLLSADRMKKSNIYEITHTHINTQRCYSKWLWYVFIYLVVCCRRRQQPFATMEISNYLHYFVFCMYVSFFLSFFVSVPRVFRHKRNGTQTYNERLAGNFHSIGYFSTSFHHRVVLFCSQRKLSALQCMCGCVCVCITMCLYIRA